MWRKSSKLSNMKEPDLSETKKRLEHAYDLVTTTKDYEGALRICDEVLEEHPNMLAAIREKAAIHAYVKNYEEAINLISDVIAQDPNEPGYYFKRAWSYLENGNLAEAVQDLTKTLELGSQRNFHYYTESAYFFRAVALLKLARYSEAVADCEHVRDDFLIYLYSTGKISKSDILEQATRCL